MLSWAIIAHLVVFTAGCSAPELRCGDTETTSVVAHPYAGNATNDVQVNGEWLRLPLKFQPYWDRMPLDASMRAQIDRSGIRLEMLWLISASSPRQGLWSAIQSSIRAL